MAEQQLITLRRKVKYVNTEQALEFLRKHQPMPPELELTQEQIDQYDAVRQHFIKYPDPRCVPLFLGSFGEGTGYGLYQLIDDVLRMYPEHFVIGELAKALRSPHRSVRTWCLDMAMGFAHERLRPIAMRLAASSDETESGFASTLLELIDRGPG